MCKVKQVVILLCVINFPAVVLALGTEDFGDKPIEPSADWLAGTVAMVESPGRVYSKRVNGDENFYYKGSTVEFNEFLKKFVAVKAPVHRLILQKEYRDKSLDFCYDWLLRVPSGLYRNQLIREKGKGTSEIYPSIVVPSGSTIRFEEVIVPSGVDIIYPEDIEGGDYVKSIIPRFKNAQAWSSAKTKWLKFIEPYLENIRQEEKDPSRQCVEVKSALISKYLPKHKIYIIDTGRSNLFALSITGEISDLNRGDWSTKEGEKLSRNDAFSAFFKQLKIIVSDANEALEIGKLVEEITFASSRWKYLKSNTENFSIFEMSVFYGPGTYWLRDWKWYANKEESHWIVSGNYIGPSACIEGPPEWVITVDKDNRIVEINRR
jgi:hypothetical protein